MHGNIIGDYKLRINLRGDNSEEDMKIFKILLGNVLCFRLPLKVSGLMIFLFVHKVFRDVTLFIYIDQLVSGWQQIFLFDSK